MASFIAEKVRNRTPKGSDHILVEWIMNFRWIKRPLKKQENEPREDADCDEVVNGAHPPRLFLKNKRRNDHRAPANKRTRPLLVVFFVLVAGSAAFWLLSDRLEAVPEGQVIAIVDGYEITTTDLATEARMLGVSSESEAARRAVLESLIDRQILVGAAVAQGLDRDPHFQAERRRAEQMLLARLALEGWAKSVEQPTAEAVQRFIADHGKFFNERHLITLDQIRFTPATALPQHVIADMQTIEEGERWLTSRRINYERGTVVLDTVTLQPEAAGRIVHIPTGSMFYLNEGGRGALSRVMAREHLPVSHPERQVIAGRVLSGKAVSGAFRNSLRTKRGNAKIRYQ
ncbi:MAG: hypothetical protein H0V01_15590, partial [Bacteroidetes bacterium]|nr:hypothetical protein [Bacteroidota bacterium]